MYAHPLIHADLARQHELDLRRRLARPRPLSRRHPSTAGDADAAVDLRALVEAARTGDQHPWDWLVQRFTPSMRAVARGYRLSAAEIDDVVQTAWTSAFRNITSLREPEAMSGWLMVTTRREALRTLERRRHEILVDEPSYPDESDHSTPEGALVHSEQQAAMRAAIRRLPDRQRSVMNALLDHSGASYADLTSRLNMPLGSIGPTRERALVRLRRDRRLTETIAS